MIIRLFNTKNGARSAVNYLLSGKDHKGNVREVPPKILRGDPTYTKQLDELTKKYAYQVSSGVIAFRDNETITEEQREKLLDDFEDTFIGSEMKDKVNVFIVEHKDKGNTEYHFVINRVAIMEDGKHKHFNAFPPGHQKLKDAFVALKNDELGFDQVEEKKIMKTKYSGEERKAIRSGKHGFKDLDSKVKLDKAMKGLVKDGEVKNRRELISFLQDNGCVLSRIGDDYISIKNEEGRNMRFRGGIYEHNEGKDYSIFIKETKESKKPYFRETALTNYLDSMQKRSTINEKRYGVKDNPTGYISAPILKPVDNHKKIENNAVELPKAVSIPDKNPQTVIEPIDKSQTPPSTPNSAPVMRSSAQERLSDALSELANSRTHQEIARAKKAVIAARIAVERENAENKL
jgi:hypothetical protein